MNTLSLFLISERHIIHLSTFLLHSWHTQKCPHLNKFC